MSQTETLAAMIAMASCASVIVAGLVRVNGWSFGGGEGGKSGKGGGGATIGDPLPIPDPFKKDRGPWYIRSNVRPENTKITSDGLQVTYVKGKFANDSGTIFHANPNKKLPADRAGISCSVFVPKDFPWVLTGKFGIGLCLGEGPYDCATGGNWQKDAGSVRISWSYKDGKASVGPYVYLPLQGGGLKAQPSSFRAVADDTERTGIHMFRGEFPVNAGSWVDVALEVILNTPGKADGSLKFTVDGRSRSLSGISWRSSPSVKINQVTFSTFFGGSTSKYAPPKDATLTFKNFGFFA